VKFTWERESPTGSCALMADPGDYDGHPMPALLSTDMVPRTVSPDRLAVAFVLAFHPFISGEVSFPYGIHPEVASAVGEFMKPTTVFISDIDFKVAIIPSGGNTFAINPGGQYQVNPSWKDFDSERAIELNLPSVSDSFSHNFHNDVLTVPTNAAAFYADSNKLAGAAPYIAVAVLLSEDFDVGTIRLPFGDPQTAASQRMAALMQASGLILRFLD
jgi:hypothetical protein